MINLRDEFPVQLFPDGNIVKTIKLSDGTCITLAKENNVAVDGRVIFKRHSGKPLLVCLQIRFSEARKCFSEGELDVSCKDVTDCVTAAYPEHEVVLVIVTNDQ